jgi:hypothetical protein
LTATPDTNKTFAGWTGGGCSGTGSCKTTISADTTVTATFSTPAAKGKKKLTIIKGGMGMGFVASSPSGVDCGTVCEAEYDEGTVVTLADKTADDPSFAGWSGGGCSGTGACVVTMTADTVVTATFNAATSSGSSGGGGCFIATAAYGSYLDPHVYVLRNFRDRYLLTNFLCCALMNFYYDYSSPIAAFIRKHEVLKTLGRFTLTPIVYGIEHPYSSLMVLIIPVGILLAYRRKQFKKSH